MADDLTIRIGARSDAYQKELDKIKGQTKTFENQLRSLSRISAVAFTGLILTAGSAVKAFAKFDNELRSVRTLLNESSFGAKSLEEGFAEMKKEALALGAASSVSIGALNKALFDTVSAGVDASEAVGVLAVTSKLAVAGLTEVNIATDGVTSALNAYGLEASEAENVAAKFFQAQVQGKTTIAELSNFFGRAGATASAFGVSLDELLASVSAATTGGIKTQAAFTGLNAVLANISKPTKDAAKEAKRLGIEFNSTTLRTKGLAKFINDLTKAEKFNKVSIEKLFGSIEAQKLIFALTGEQAEAFTRTLKLLGEEEENVTMFTEAFNVQSQSLENRLKVLKNQVLATAINIGEKLAPAVVFAVDAFISLFDLLRTNPALTAVIAQFLGVATAVTGLVTVLGFGAIAFLNVRAAVISLIPSIQGLTISTRALFGATGLGLALIFLPQIIAGFNALGEAIRKGTPAERVKTLTNETKKLVNQNKVLKGLLKRASKEDKTRILLNIKFTTEEIKRNEALARKIDEVREARILEGKEAKRLTAKKELEAISDELNRQIDLRIKITKEVRKEEERFEKLSTAAGRLNNVIFEGGFREAVIQKASQAQDRISIENKNKQIELIDQTISKLQKQESAVLAVIAKEQDARKDKRTEVAEASSDAKEKEKIRDEEIQNARNRNEILKAQRAGSLSEEIELLKERQAIITELAEAELETDRELKALKDEELELRNALLIEKEQEQIDKREELRLQEKKAISKLEGLTSKDRDKLAKQQEKKTKEQRARDLKAFEKIEIEKRRLAEETARASLAFAQALGDAIIALTGDNFFAGLILSKSFAVAQVFIDAAKARMAATVASLQAGAAAGPAAVAVAAATFAGFEAAIDANTALALGTIGAQSVAAVARHRGQEGGLVSGLGQGDKIPFLLEPKEFITPADTADEVINATAQSRIDRGETAFGDVDREGSAVEVTVGFTENAFEILEQKQLERDRLNTGLS